MGILLTESTSSATSMIGIIIFYVVFLGGLMYFMAIRPQKKQQKKQNELINSMEVGDYVKTTSGFYGSVISITDDSVIVEFGNNKNCRIPMDKEAIVQVEKLNQE
jgi:preprotein translocase subunit YajC